MGSSGSISEIIEEKEELNFVHNANGSNLLNFKLKADQRDGKTHVYPVDDDLDQLIKAIDLRTSSRIAGPSHQMGVDASHKNSLKKPTIVGVSQVSGIGIPESVTLKQALRKSCISHASEMASMKRLSKPIGISGISEAGTIQSLYTSVVVQASNSGLPLNDEKGNILEISLVPEKNATSSENTTEIHQASDIGSSNQSVMSSTYSAMPIKIDPKKPGKRGASIPSSGKAGDSSSTAADIGIRGKVNSKISVPASLGGVQARKPGIHPRLSKLGFRNKAYPRKKGKQDPFSIAGSSSRCQDDNRVGAVSLRTKLPFQEDSQSLVSCNMNPDGIFGMKNKDDGANKANCILANSKGVVTPVGVKVSGSSRAREKRGCSQSSKSSLGDHSSSTSISEESNLSGSSGNISRPHMSKDMRWVAIRRVVMRHGSLSLKNFKLLKRLGSGDIGTVYLAELIGSECLFALKVMDNEFLMSRKKMPRAQTEKEILQVLDHPFLPTLYAHFTTDNLSCLVMEYCPGGDLHVLRQKQPGRSFNEAAARFYVAEVLLALEYLHMLGVVYRDLKPENILVREDGHIMLSDFDLSLRCAVNPTLLRSSSLGIQEFEKKLPGPCAQSSCIDPLCLQPSWSQVSCFTPRLVSRKLKPGPSIQASRLPQLVVEPTDARSNSFVGTHEYLAPEIIRGDGHGSAVDWWTFGIFLYELLYGKTPFKGPGNEETLTNVISQNLRFPEAPVVSFHARDLIRGFLVKEPEHRLGSSKGAAEIKQHPFFDGLNWALIRCAVPPETLRNHDSGAPIGVQYRKEGKCLDFRTSGEYVEFELF